MKKVLEGELLSLAHRVLQLKDKEVDSLYKEAKELYEKLLILKFYQDNFEAGLIKDVTSDQLDDALKAMVVANSSSNAANQDVRHQMPEDLVEEEYPIVTDSEKEFISAREESLLADRVTKIAPIIPHEAIEPKKVAYDEPFITDVYIDNNADEEDDAQLHQYLDQHDAMLKQNDERVVTVTPVLEDVEVDEEDSEEENDDIEVTTFYDNSPNEEEVIEEEVEPSFTDRDIQEAIADINQQFSSASIVEERVDGGVSMTNDDPFHGFDFGDVQFVRVQDIDKKEEEKFDAQFTAVESDSEEKLEEEQAVATGAVNTVAQNTLFNVESTSVREPKISKPRSINDIYSSTIVVGLNDRIAFERHLFNGSAEDFNRVLSQLNTVSSFDEANSLIDHLVRPEYNNWEGKDEYAERFMALVEKRFI